jgi:hypothetical protein
MKKIKPKTRKIYEFFEVEHAAEALASEEQGRKVNFRDYANKYDGAPHEERPYLDYWHHICDGISNGCLTTFNWSEMAEDWEQMYPNKKWLVEVFRYFARVVPEGDLEYEIRW